MKKVFKTVLVLALAVLCLTALAAAAEAPASGICDVAVEADFNGKVTLQAQKADGTPVTTPTAQEGGKQVYAEAVKVKLTYSGNAANQYLVLALNDNTTVPTEGNVAYVDQASGTLNFTIYPSELVSGKTYNIYLTSNAASGDVTTMTKVGSFGYYAAYKLGDVNNDKAIDVFDAMEIVNHALGKQLLTGNNLLAADVDRNNEVDVFDAMGIVNYALGKVTEF